jgi:hypothetical protein
MAVTVTPAVTGHRPGAVWTTIGVLVFLGVSAVAGGVAMVFGIGAAPPHEWLDRIPVLDTWVVPGLVQIAWIVIELTYIPLSGLQAVYGGIGVALLLLLPLHPAVRVYLAVDAGPQP